MPSTSITCRYRFSAAHVLRRGDLSADENHALFGPCARPHGHNYELWVTVRGRVDPRSGMVVNFTQLDGLVQELVLEPCDHHDLDGDVPFLEGVLTTAENLVDVFWKRLEPKVQALAPGAGLARLRLFETHDAWVDREA